LTLKPYFKKKEKNRKIKKKTRRKKKGPKVKGLRELEAIS